MTRVMSESSATGTPRTSSDFYSASNHSDETVTSELPTQTRSHHRWASEAVSAPDFSVSGRQNRRPAARPETLMLGYAQTMGHFILDGSLVNAAPFEEIKRKGVQGGGGVVGVDQAKASAGMFGAFSWGSIGDSLGGLLGVDEKSSIAQMKATAGSKSIPLLSTPQNLLFVDLTLAPGESKSFAYRFPLPRGLPPSYRGRAIKVSYHLSLGVQRPAGQTVKHIEIPFRVIGSYNAQGELLGHDLMSPYTLLQDTARSKSIAPDLLHSLTFPELFRRDSAKATPQQGLEDFLRYTERLLEESEDSTNPLASPTSPGPQRGFSRTSSIVEPLPASTKEAIDLAIMRANHIERVAKQRQGDANPSANRFNISRAGQPVAVLTILRPAYRLGEAVIGTIDFTAPSPSSATTASPHIPTYAVLVELESAEQIDASLALRSKSSIHRVTRKTHAAVRENTLFARHISFNLTIPPTATPSFDTTGVSLVWRLRVEFTVPRQGQPPPVIDIGGDEDDDEPEAGAAKTDAGELLEEIGRDERGVTFIAKERLWAETFEIGVPLRVYGVPAEGEGEGLESGAWEV